MNETLVPTLEAATPQLGRLVVMKFGGTSVGDPARIRAVAARALAAQRRGDRPVLVVSAMAGETDRLLAQARQLNDAPDAAEVDTLAATGEQVAAALTALAIQALGGRARSFLGYQLALRTAGPHGEARVRSLDAKPLLASVARGEIPVVAGFQGIGADGRLTTLGRGGSDTTAVAVAAALGASECEIYTDVDGVFVADPNIVPGAKHLTALAYEPMLALAAAGAKVLHARSVALAARHGVAVRVRSSFTDLPGTLVAGHARVHDAPPATGVTADKAVVGVELRGQGGRRLALTARRVDLPRLRAAFAAEGWALAVDEGVAAVSLAGAAATDPGVAAGVIACLARAGLEVRGLALAEQTVTCLVSASAAAEAVRALSQAFAN